MEDSSNNGNTVSTDNTMLIDDTQNDMNKPTSHNADNGGKSNNDNPSTNSEPNDATSNQEMHETIIDDISQNLDNTDYELFDDSGNNMSKKIDEYRIETKILVLGIGGCGSNAANSIYKKSNKTDYVDFACVNTDISHLRKMEIPNKIMLGKSLTKGQGAGANPEIGEQAAKESDRELRELVDGYDMVFIVAGMGGGTGTGASPVIADMVKDTGVLTVAVVTLPFEYEGKKKARVAKAGIQALEQAVHCLIKIPNQKLLDFYTEESTIDSYEKPNDLLYSAVDSITSTIASSGLINADFADVRAIMLEGGLTIIGCSEVMDAADSKIAVEKALHHPLLSDVTVKQANGILINFTTGKDFTIKKMQEAMTAIEHLDDDNTTIIWGHDVNSEFNDKIYVSLIVTGINASENINNIKGAESLILEAGDNKFKKGVTGGKKSSSEPVWKSNKKQDSDMDVYEFFKTAD